MLEQLVDLFEFLRGFALRIVCSLHAEGCRSRNQDSMGHSSAPVTRKIPNRLRPAHGMAYEHDLLEFQRIHDGGNIIRQGIEIVAAAGVFRTCMTAPVERDTTPAAFNKIHYRDVPPVRAQSPRRKENDGTADTPVAEVNPGSIVALDHRSILSDRGRSAAIGLLGPESKLATS